MKRSCAGFTLMELMIVMAIIGIIAAFAYPSYMDSILRGQRSAGKTALTDMAARQESYRADRKTYASSLTALGYPADTSYVKKDGGVVASNADAIYSVSVESGATTTTYSIAAVPINSQTKDTRCGTLRINQLGVKSASGAGGTECWRR